MIGQLVKQWRDKKGWSQTDLARECQLIGFDASRSTINNIESQIRKVSDIEFALIAKALKKPLRHVLVPDELPEWKMRPYPSRN